MKVEILAVPSGKTLVVLNAEPTSTIADLKKQIAREKKNLYVERQSLRPQLKSKSIADNVTLQSLDLKTDCKLYLKDLGPQVGWTTVFFWEYFGPLVMYLISYIRPPILYGDIASNKIQPIVQLILYYLFGTSLFFLFVFPLLCWTVFPVAAICWTIHYVKRILETFFVHRFSKGTMPIQNMFRNCTYYWTFAFFIGYSINHPLYTPASFGAAQIYVGLIGFALSEIGNLSIHVLLRNLRPPGTKERKIPQPTSNPFTLLFHLVSCPNYTYEVMAWFWFSVMTQCLTAFLFTLAGFYPMAIWALQKHRSYKKDFPNYPKQRKAIVPFFL